MKDEIRTKTFFDIRFFSHLDQVLNGAADLIIERSSVSSESFRLISVQDEFYLKNVVQPAKKYLFLVTAGVLSPSVAHSDLNVLSSHNCTDCFAFDNVIDRLHKNQIELIVSGDKDEEKQVDWGFNTRSAHLTGEKKHLKSKSIPSSLLFSALGGIFVPLKHLEKFLSKFVDNVNSGAFNLHEILAQVENEGSHDNSQSNGSIVQRSAPVPIRNPSLINPQDETMIVGRPDAKRILYGFSPWK